MRIEALLFDVFGTVVDWRGSIARQAAAEFSDLDPISGGDWNGFADAWRRGYQPAMEEVRSGRRPFVPLDLLHHEILESVAGEFGLAGLPAERLDRVNRFWHALDPWPDSVAGMIRLRRRFVLAAHSNGNIALMVNMARRASLPWDMILGGEVTGFYKPMPQSYIRAAEMLGLAPNRCMMVAAHNRDLVAAASCGLRTAFILRPEEHGPGQTTDLAPTGDWDFGAVSMEDLASQLDL